MASLLSTSSTVILTLLMFGVLITIHEFGHYIVARLFGVGIIEFSIGMGPKLFSWKGKKNLFSIRLLPIGGYVNMVGEYGSEDETLSEEDKNKPPFNEKPIWQRLLVVLAGPFMNVLLGLVVMFCLVLHTDVIGSLSIADFDITPNAGYVTSGNNMLYIAETDNKDEKGFLEGDVIVSVDGETFIANGLSLGEAIGKFGTPKTVKVMRKNIVVDIENPVLPDSSCLALSGNLMAGDEIVEIDGTNIYVYSDISSQIARLGIKPISVTVERNGTETTVENVIFPKYSEKNVLFGESDFRVYRKEKTFGNVLYEAFFKSISTLKMTVYSITDTFTGRYGVEALSGPIGIGGQVGEMVKSDFPVQNFLTLMVLVSLSLGICNLLPLPVLDGGRVVIFLVEAVRRKPLNPKIESAIMAVSMAAVLLLMFAVALKDIVALF